MKILFPLLTLTVSTLSILAQSNDYQRVVNAGTLPSEVYTPSTEKFKTTIEDLDSDLSKEEAKVQKQYYLESGFGIDEMMRSGTVLYNPEYNDYLNRIADELLKNDPALRGDVRFYILRSPVVNAFAGAGGNIFISMGLIAMLDNEAELAFIMGHEIGHIAKDHGLDYFVTASDIDKKSTDNALFKKSSSFDPTSIAKNMYSQALETEADDYGIDILRKSKYWADTNALNAAFDVLKYAYLPYENEAFPISFFEGEHYKISNNLKLDSIKPITGTPELLTKKEALKSTHPSIGERRKTVNQKLGNLTNENRQAYIVSEADFRKLRNAARYELPMFYLHNEFFQDAIYLSYLGLQKDPGNKYLEKIIGKSLTAYSKFRNSKEDEVYAEKARFEDYEGEQQQLYYLLWAINDAELNTMALLYNFKLHLKYPEDPEIIPQCQALVNDMVFYHFNDEEDFLMGKNISTDSLYLLSDQANPKLKVAPPSSTSKVKTRKASVRSKRTTAAKVKIDKNKKQLLYAFNDYWENKDFRRLWNEAVVERDKREAEAKDLRKQGYKIKDTGDKRDYFFGQKLGVEKVIVVNPFYKRIDLRKENAVEYVSSEEGELNYLEVLKTNAALVDIQLEILDPLTLQATDVEKFNDMNELNDWFSEQLDFGSINLPGYNQAVIDSIATKYGTDYFLWTGIVSLRDKQNLLGPILYIALSPAFIPLLPYGIYELVTPEYEFFYLSLLYDVKTHEGNVLKFLFLKNNDSRAILNSHTYEMLNQIAAKPNNN
ncbi:MAG TPA: M48 family metallopeptidase [Chitinophagales bacterium]|nr:M48 family metallopeptidase [Chitinophagales bacterium]HNE46104.1 M48 family metallopeptidase [Chitinophagales bacterium]HNF68176.1 M48 family metallopeptidase [Chitinophagales bacterium]HNI53856.1 M48 family metallopeptidase [Chitinophagales bacterium]HNM08447.1 M48 family metallopeptidase [Chitinophagales bacterium]